MSAATSWRVRRARSTSRSRSRAGSSRTRWRSGAASTRPSTNAWNRRADDAPDAVGISNQRESVVVWDRATGRPVGPTIVWQCRRTAPFCETLRDRGLGATLEERTGLTIDPLFSASKIRWLLDSIPDGDRRAERGELCAGTIDSWLLWNLTGGAIHACDATNASRTQLFNLREAAWDATLLDIFRIPRRLLPDVKPSSGVFGHTISRGHLGGVPIASAIGDSHAALFGHAAFRPGSVKATYGTGSSLMTPVDDAVGFEARTLDDRRLGPARQGVVRARRQHHRDGRRGRLARPVTWSREFRLVGRGPRPLRGRLGRRLPGAGICRARRAVLGCRCARTAVRRDPRARRPRTSHARRSSPSPTRCATSSTRCGRTRARRRRCWPTAAQAATIRSCSFRPTSSDARSSATIPPICRHAARHGSPASPSASGRRLTRCRGCRGPSPASSRAWPTAERVRLYSGWQDAVARARTRRPVDTERT